MSSVLKSATGRDKLIAEYQRIRAFTETLCKPLQVDDFQIQVSSSTRPAKWHLAHVSWFFEDFVLSRMNAEYLAYHQTYAQLFSSEYHVHAGDNAPIRPGNISRPTIEEVFRYRAHIDKRVIQLLADTKEDAWQEVALLVTLGLNHEQQHQELMLVDLKRSFFENPLKPAYRGDLLEPKGKLRSMSWVLYGEGIYFIGHDKKTFAYQNEKPRHKVMLHGFRLADRLITNTEYMDFIKDGGYDSPTLWLADGWSLRKQYNWHHPLYWLHQDGSWQQFTLGGLRPLNPAEPVCHISFYEADAYARWAGKRLPLEAELEIVLEKQQLKGNFVQTELFHPEPASGPDQWWGDLWNWTASPYCAYPGTRRAAAPIGEYDGKFMSNRMVLKGGSCATPPGHTRATYRNFLRPQTRRAFSGIRLADDI